MHDNMAQAIAPGVRQGHGLCVGWKLPTLVAVLWVVVLTAAGAGLGVLIAGPKGALFGAIPLSLGTVLAGYVPGIREGVQRGKDQLEQLEQEAAAAEKRWDEVGEPVADAGVSGPASLLRADREIVDFAGRETELELLRAWLAADELRSVRTIIGPGGVGKTRLALELASEWRSMGGEWRRVDAGQEANAVAAARNVTYGPVLLLVDYAETRTDLGTMLRAVLADKDRIRVLLIARSLGEWWDRLIEESPPAIGRLLTETGRIALAEQLTQHTSDADLVAHAVPQFARALGCPVPEQIAFEIPNRPVPVLVLHTAALVAVLRYRDKPLASLSMVVAEGLLDELLEHEARYWRRTALAAGLPGDGPLLKAVVAAAALLGAGNLAATAELVARVPDLSDVTQAQRRSWARWLYVLYPADSAGGLGVLRPDLLAETHVIMRLDADTELAASCLRNLSEPQAGHALTVLARAWTHHEEAGRIIAEALHADLAHLAIPAARVAVQSGNILGMLLAAALEDAPISGNVLAQVAYELPFPSVVLARPHLAAAMRVRDSLGPDTEPEILAEWNDRAGMLLYQLGRSAEALPCAQEAVEIYRDLTRSNPGSFQPNLAASLSNLGVRLGGVGSPADALSATQEAVDIYRHLTQISPDIYRPDLASVLGNLGFSLSELGRPTEAVSATGEAVRIYRQLTQINPDLYRPDLARALDNLGIWLHELGRPADALPHTEEAVAIRRGLAQVNPDRYRPDLARSLSNLGVRFAELGRADDALAAEQEAVTIRRDLAQVNPGLYRPELASSLSNLGNQLAALSRADDALAAEQEAVTIRRDLAQINPDRYRPELALSLANLGVRLVEKRCPADALPVTEEAVAIYRELLHINPDRHRPELARSLEILGAVIATLGRPADGLAATEEAVVIFRELTLVNPDLYRPQLARSLSNLATPLAALNKLGDAQEAQAEANRLRNVS